MGGNAQGANCFFPFIYSGKLTYKCITDNNDGKLWCATTPSYDDDRVWGNCDGKTLDHTGGCSDRQLRFNDTTTLSDYMCRLLLKIGGTDVQVSLSVTTGTACDSTTTRRPTSAPSSTLTPYSLPCTTYTVGGNSAGANCVFPFIYDSITRYYCIATNNDGQLWCATTANYDTDRKWGNCAGKT